MTIRTVDSGNGLWATRLLRNGFDDFYILACIFLSLQGMYRRSPRAPGRFRDIEKNLPPR